MRRACCKMLHYCFRGRRRASHIGVGGGKAPAKCIRFINPTHTSSRRAIFKDPPISLCVTNFITENGFLS